MNLRRFRFAVHALVPIALAVLPAACNRNEPENETPSPAATQSAPKEHAYARFVNATTEREPVAFFFGENLAASGVTPSNVTEYKEVEPKRHEIELRPSTEGRPAATNSESLNAGGHYTVVGFTGKQGKPEVTVFEDKENFPEAGMARIRLINLADEAAELDLSPAGAKDSLVTGVNFNTASYVSVDPTVKAIEIRRKGESVVSLNVTNLTLEPGQTETIIVAADPNRKLRAIHLEDSTGAPVERQSRMKP